MHSNHTMMNHVREASATGSIPIEALDALRHDAPSIWARGQVLAADLLGRTRTLRLAKTRAEREAIYLTLSGRWQVRDGPTPLRSAGTGALLGAAGFFAPGGRRPFSVWAESGGRLLMLRHSRLRLLGHASRATREAQRALYSALALSESGGA